MDGIRGSRVLEFALVGAIGIASFFGLSFVVAGFRNPIVLALAPFVAIGVYRAAAYPWRPWWRPWQFVAILVLLGLLLVPFLISPTYLGRNI
jgi:energy-coupling factor transporter transmembrane protein EcfT